MNETLRINNDIELRLLNQEHSDELFTVIAANRAFLRQWLPWVDATIAAGNADKFVRLARHQYESGRGPQYAIYYRSALCGTCGFHPIEPGRKVASIGYWITEDVTGKGVATRAVHTLIPIGFRDYALDKIEISCATENRKSRAIPERLGFTLEGIAKQQERLYHGYVDHAIYSLLATTWAGHSSHDD